MKLKYTGWREEISLHEIGVVKNGESFDCTPEMGAYLVKRFNLPGEIVNFTEPKEPVKLPEAEKVAPIVTKKQVYKA
jgi:hypothetical protein